jgi:hypothetical protein
MRESKTSIIKRQSKITPCCEETVYLRKKVESQKRAIKALRDVTGMLLERLHDAEEVMFSSQGQDGVPDSFVPFLKYNGKWKPTENMVTKEYKK